MTTETLAVVAGMAVAPPARASATWLRSRAEWTGLKAEWRAAHRRQCPDDMDSDPDWCEGTEAAYPGALQTVSLVNDGVLAAVVPLFRSRIPFECRVGTARLLRLRPQVLELGAAALAAAGASARPQASATFDAFFAALGARQGHHRYDALSLTVPTHSEIWTYLQTTDWRRHGLRLYQPAPPAPHHRIRMAPTFDAYLAKFTPKTRKNRLRELKHLEQRGAVELLCYRHPQQVDAFLAAAQAISGRSYQHKLLQAGLRETARLLPRLRVAADHGWLRSYVLRCGGVACSYMLGYQYQGHYHYTSVGYDPAWKDMSVGTVLQLLVLQEMHRDDPPRLFEFGVQAPQKEYFGNEQFEQATVLLFARRPYPWAARHLHQWSARAARSSVRLLDRYQLKPAARRWLRRLRGC